MKRLAHTEGALVRALQMSSATFFVFVEGVDSDPYFYGKMCSAVLDPLKIKYEVRTASELASTGNGNGKQELLNFYSSLKKGRMLERSFKGKKTVICFYLDKDIDDILKIKKKSKYIFYTDYYCIENHIVIHSDFYDAVAAATSCDVQVVKKQFGDKKNWLLRVAIDWQEWVRICICTSLLKIRCSYCYGQRSQIHDRAGKFDAKLHRQAISEIIKISGLQKFKKAYAHATRIVRATYSNNSHDHIYKGKWYLEFIEESAREIARNVNRDALLASMRTKLDFDEQWANSFKQSLSGLARAAYPPQKI